MCSQKKTPKPTKQQKTQTALFLQLPVTTDSAAATTLHAGMAPIHAQMGS